MATNREKQRAEAVERLKILEYLGQPSKANRGDGLLKDVRRDFENGRVHYSERIPLGGGAGGALFWIDNDTAKSDEGRPFADVVSEFESEHGAVVYHATHEHTEFGELLDLFFVSKHEDEWEQDRRDLGGHFCLAYVANLSDPMFSEFGTIGFRPAFGGLVRTA